ncbi:hypothetical protein UT300005_09030 [Clostridium sp. CTA-5]
MIKKSIVGLIAAALTFSSASTQFAWAGTNEYTQNDTIYKSNQFEEILEGTHSAVDENGITWEYKKLKNGTIKICGTVDVSSYIEVPSELDGFVVSSIGHVVTPSVRTDPNFGKREKEITKVKIPSSVKRIDAFAFDYCKNLKDINLPSSVISIGNKAFNGTPWFENQRNSDGLVIINGILMEWKDASGDITIPSDIKSIGDGVFFNTNITSVAIPKGVKSIGKSSFERCSNLTKVIMPSSVKSIGDYAFRDCTKLTNIKIPSNMSYVGTGAFERVPLTDAETNSDGLIITNGILVSGVNASGNVKIPESVTTIKDGAFSGCKNIKNVKIPSSVKSIGRAAFSGCKNLTSVDIEDGITKIELGTFDQCINLKSIKIPSSVTNIDYGFDGCVSLNEIEFSSNLTDISYGVFRSTPWIEDHMNSDGLVIIDDVLVYARGNIKEAIIPDGVTAIAKKAFNACFDLNKVEIPSSVKRIGESAFESCTNIRKVEIPGSVKSIGKNAFPGGTTLTGDGAKVKPDESTSETSTDSGKIQQIPTSTVKQGWHQEGENWYWLWSDGTKRNGWLEENGQWYYFYGNGQMATGFINLNGAIYYLNPVSNGYKGAMLTGWQRINGYWYYFNPLSDGYKGIMKRGWINEGGNWYYLYYDGTMASNTTINGYYVNSSGAWVQ